MWILPYINSYTCEFCNVSTRASKIEPNIIHEKIRIYRKKMLKKKKERNIEWRVSERERERGLKIPWKRPSTVRSTVWPEKLPKFQMIIRSSKSLLFLSLPRWFALWLSLFLSSCSVIRLWIIDTLLSSTYCPFVFLSDSVKTLFVWLFCETSKRPTSQTPISILSAVSDSDLHFCTGFPTGHVKEPQVSQVIFFLYV